MEYLSSSRSLDPDEVKEGINVRGEEGLYLLDGVCHIEKIGMANYHWRYFVNGQVFVVTRPNSFCSVCYSYLDLDLDFDLDLREVTPRSPPPGRAPPTHGNHDNRPQQPPSGQSPQEGWWRNTSGSTENLTQYPVCGSCDLRVGSDWPKEENRR